MIDHECDEDTPSNEGHELTPLDRFIQSGTFESPARGYYLGKAIELITKYNRTGDSCDWLEPIKEAIVNLEKLIQWMESDTDKS